MYISNMKIFKKIFITLIIFLAIAPFVVGKVIAASLSFSPTTATTTNGGTFQVAVTIDPGSDSLNSTDAYVTYDPILLKPTNVAAGTLFPTVTNDLSTSGKAYIAGLVNDTASPITKAGTVATITFQALKEGTGNLAYDCNSSKIVKNDLNATNVMVCASNGTSAVTVGAGGSNTTAPTPTGATTGGTTTGSLTPTVPPTNGGQLPVTGTFDNLIKYAVPGSIIFMLGLAVRIIL